MGKFIAEVESAGGSAGAPGCSARKVVGCGALVALALTGLVGCSLFSTDVPSAGTPASQREARAQEAKDQEAEGQAKIAQREERDRIAKEKAFAEDRAEQQRARDESAARGKKAEEQTAKVVKRIHLREDFPRKLRAIDDGRADTFFGEVDMHERALASAKEKLTALKAEYDDPEGLDDEHKQIAAREAALADYETRIAAEKVCRPDKACMEKRRKEHMAKDAAVICDDMKDHESALADVAEIRRNGARFGVIDKVELANAADHVLAVEASIKQDKANFQETWGTPFTPGLCPK